MSALVPLPYRESRRAPWWRLVLGWIFASFSTGLLSSLANSYANLSSLKGLDVDISLGTLASQSLTDYIGVGPILTMIIAIAMAIAFSVAGVIRLKIKPLRSILYMLAGAACVLTMFLLMEQAFFGTPIIQGVRTASGLAVQASCGAIGGLVFARVSRPKLY